jgi:phosphoglycolate phosphatase-like HAD superfamily hydrolase
VPSAPATEAEIDRLLDAYLGVLEAELAHATGYRVLPGVHALLESLEKRPNIAVGLGTGNVRRGAYAKLARGSLGSAFSFGGFGCDAEDRTELLRAGAVRGAEALGAPLSECEVVVIGDTPKDVAAAKGIGARCVAVATGGFTRDALVQCGADHAFDTLEDPGVEGALFPEAR